MSLVPRTSTLLGFLGQAQLKFVVAGTLIFMVFCWCPKFCDFAKQRRKMFWEVSEAGENEFPALSFPAVPFSSSFFFSAAIAGDPKQGFYNVRMSWRSCNEVYRQQNEA